MKKIAVVAVLIGVLVTVLAGTALAQGPTNPVAPGTGQGFGPGNGIHAPGTGLANGTCANCSADGAGTGLGYGLRGGMGMRGAASWAGLPDEVTTLLKLSQEQIQAQRLAGKSLVEIAKAQGVDEQTLLNTILGAKKADLGQAVKDGTLTQAQADAMYARMQQQESAMINRANVGPAWAQDGENGAAGSVAPRMGRGRMGR